MQKHDYLVTIFAPFLHNIASPPEVDSRTQGSKPRPKPPPKKSEAKAKAKNSPSEDRPSRGQE